MSHDRTDAHRRLPARLGAAALALALVAGASGCGKAADKFSEKAAEKATEKAIESGSDGKADVDLSDGEVNIETEDGSMSMGGQEVPDSWPEDVPLPPDLEVVNALEMGSGDGDITNVSGRTGMSTDDVMAFYESELDGWTEAASLNQIGDEGGMASVTYERDGRNVRVSVLEDPNDEEGILLTVSYSARVDE